MLLTISIRKALTSKTIPGLIPGLLNRVRMEYDPNLPLKFELLQDLNRLSYTDIEEK